jgi:hypothetical protein
MFELEDKVIWNGNEGLVHYKNNHIIEVEFTIDNLEKKYLAFYLDGRKYQWQKLPCLKRIDDGLSSKKV